MITFEHHGNFKKTDNFLRRVLRLEKKIDFDKYGQMGVEVLRQNTPSDSGETADSWSYEVIEDKNSVRIIWSNSNVINDKGSIVPVAILLQYGHATRNGGFVEGIDYINPALKPLFDELVNKAWKEMHD